MRTWKQLWESLTRAPLGHNADGRPIGVGLAYAQERARRNVAADAENYLHDTAGEQRVLSQDKS